jgi:hypothetical protein
MHASIGQTEDRTRSPRCRPNPFRYCAALTGTGEAQAIQEFIGRRFVRQIDPRSRLGRRLLAAGEVALWCEPVAQGERLPVSDVLRRLHEQVQNEMDRQEGDPARYRSRLQIIDDWRSFYSE